MRDLIFASNLMPPGSYAAHGEVVAEAASRALNSPGPQPAHRPAPSLLAWSESGATRPTSPESAAKAGGDTNSTFKDVAAWVAGMGQASTSTMQVTGILAMAGGLVGSASACGHRSSFDMGGHRIGQ